MKYTSLLLMVAGLLPITATTESMLPLDPQVYGMQKPFGPPKPITPKDVMAATSENQFDHKISLIIPRATMPTRSMPRSQLLAALKRRILTTLLKEKYHET